MSIESVMLSNLCRPPPSPPALNLSQHQGLSQWISSSHQVMVDIISDPFSSLHICSPVCGHTSLTGSIWRCTPLISRSSMRFLQLLSFLSAPLVFLSWCSIFSPILSTLSFVLLLGVVLNFVFHPFDFFFFLTILRFFSSSFWEHVLLLWFVSVTACSYLKGACLFLTLRQYLRL